MREQADEDVFVTARMPKHLSQASWLRRKAGFAVSECFEVGGGSYCSYKDSMALGHLQEVLLAGFEPKEAPNQGEKFLFEVHARVLEF